MRSLCVLCNEDVVSILQLLAAFQCQLLHATLSVDHYGNHLSVFTELVVSSLQTGAEL